MAHPVLWGLSLGTALVLLGVLLDLPPLLVLAAGAGLGALNIIHARRRGYCPLPGEPGSPTAGAEPDDPP